MEDARRARKAQGGGSEAAQAPPAAQSQSPPPPAAAAAATPSPPVAAAGAGSFWTSFGDIATPAVGDAAAPAAQPMRAAAAAAAPEPAAEAPKFRPGETVCMHSLQAKPELNGGLATILSWDAANARFKVMTNAGPTLSLRPANLAPSNDKLGGTEA